MKLWAMGFGLLMLTIVTSAAGLSGQSEGWAPLPTKAKDAAAEGYRQAIARTAGMLNDERMRTMVRQHGLRLLNVTWEDTGRYKNSAVGPNISDMTIQVGVKRPGGKGYDLTLMPVIRYDNFSDRSADIDPRLFTLLVGNEKSGTLKRLSLREFLENPTRFLSHPGSWTGATKSLLAPRDTRVLVSAQACFLPVPKEGKATFNPVLFNYQSVSGDPAVLTLLVTREGTSVTIIDNQRDQLPGSPGWGQRLFHNQNGKRAPLTGERLSDFRNSTEATNSSLTLPAGDKESSGLNMVLLVQIPLKQRRPMRFGSTGDVQMSMAPMVNKDEMRRSDVEAAVIGHGEFEGPFTEIDGLAIERDPAFPVRVTVQFYKATATGIASAADIRQVKDEIDGVLEHGDVVGTLVVGGATGRVTEYEGLKVQPAEWWLRFWRRHYQNTGETPDEAIRRYQRLVGDRWAYMPATELSVAEKLRAAR